MGRFIFWILALAITVGVLWVYRRRLNRALRILMFAYPALLVASLIQSGFEADRVFLLLIMLAVAAGVLAVSKAAGNERET